MDNRMIMGSSTYCLFFKVFKNDLFLHFYLRFIGNFACLSCDGKWDEHVVLYEDEELRKELGKPVGEAFYPLSDVPEIQQQFLKQLEEEEEKAKKASEEAKNKPVEAESTIEKIETGMNQVSLGNFFSSKNLRLG